MTVTRRPTAEFVVVGSGPAGAALTARLVEAGREVMLVEAGPDFGSAHAGWPSELLDAARTPERFDWGFATASGCDASVPYPRGKVIGGSSSVNGCVVSWGCRADYDGWEHDGCDGWSSAALEPLFARASGRFRARAYRADELSPYQEAWLDGLTAAGVPAVADLNDLDGGVGVAPSPFSVADGRRWNAAFAYLDALRTRPELRIVAGATVTRLTIRRDRAVGVELLSGSRTARVGAGHVVLAAGAFGSPSILLRSGIGEPAQLARSGIEVVHPLAGVGANLHDHAAVMLAFSGSRRLVEASRNWGTGRWAPDEQVLAKLRSRHARGPFDLHLYPVGGSSANWGSGHPWRVGIGLLEPRARGSLRVTSADPAAPALIDAALGTERDDLDALADGVELVRELAAQPAVRGLIGSERAFAGATGRRALREAVRRAIVHYHHPVGTCRMGPVGDPLAVVDHTGALHGLRGVTVADCSVMPTVPRANTMIPAAVVGEHVGRMLLGQPVLGQRAAA